MIPTRPSLGESLTTREILALSRSGACQLNPLTLIEAARAVRNRSRTSTPKYGNFAEEPVSDSDAPIFGIYESHADPATLPPDTPSSMSASQPEPDSETSPATKKSPPASKSLDQPSPAPQPEPMHELLIKALVSVGVSQRTWIIYNDSHLTTCTAMRATVWRKLRSLGMSYTRVGEVTGHDPERIRQYFRKKRPPKGENAQVGA